jgi:L,D-transpeptidase ErfK/SrfK
LKSNSFVLAAILVSSMAVPLAAQETVEGLPDDAPRAGTVITVDVSTNTLYLFEDGETVVKSPVATGTGKMLVHGDDVWAFHTPRGHLKVLRKIVDPVWRKPDWAFIEAGQPIPPPDSPKRLVKGELGKYALDLGEGILIHGTEDADSIGKRASHGCIRLPAAALDKVYHSVKVGTDVYIFESHPVQESTTEIHSDLDLGRKK